MRRRSLGKGLGELISGEPLTQARPVVELALDRLSPNPRQPRAQMSGDRLEELTLSIETHGVLQPIIVRPVGDDYEIVAGERRWRAAQRAGLAAVPCMVQDVSDEDSLQIALIENLQREDLNPVEAARGYRHLIQEFGLSQEQLAQAIGKSRSAIANTMRLLDLPQPLLQAIQSGEISEGHGRALLGLSGAEDRLLELCEMIREQGLTVRDTERLVREAVAPAPEPEPTARPSAAPIDPNLRDVQERVQGALATKVVIRPNQRGGGKIEISYHDGEEFERLVELLLTHG